MPRKPIDYSNTIIYKLVCNDLAVTDIYVGHTTDFINRKRQHKKCCNNTNVGAYNYKVYQIIRENGGWDNWSMIQIEEYCCNNTNEARAKERYWIETLKSNLNVNIPNRSYLEYNNVNRKKINEKQRQYNKENRDKINENQTQYNKENKDNINDKMKTHYQKIKEIKNKKYICECGGKYSNQYKNNHLKRPIHQNYLANLKEVIV